MQSLVEAALAKTLPSCVLSTDCCVPANLIERLIAACLLSRHNVKISTETSVVIYKRLKQVERQAKTVEVPATPLKRQRSVTYAKPTPKKRIAQHTPLTRKPFKSPFTPTNTATSNQSVATPTNAVSNNESTSNALRIHKLVLKHIQSGEYATLERLIGKWRVAGGEALTYLKQITGEEVDEKDDGDRSCWDELYARMRGDL